MTEVKKMTVFDVVQAWIDNVAYSHSQSKGTALQYRRHLSVFCEFIGKTPQQILNDYEGMRDRDFRRKYAQYARALISKQLKKGYAPSSIRTQVTSVRSFFKYNDLPLGHISMGKNKITYHNRDIAHEEIEKILEISRPRDRAFYCMMAQSGLRPYTLCKLRLKHIEPEFGEEIIPCKIEVPEEMAKGNFGACFTFMGEESIKYLKAYLSTRPNIGSNDYLFMTHGATKPTTYSTFSVIFCNTIEKLKEKGMIDFNQKQEGKPRAVRLYSLRKFFRKHAGQAGIEYVNFWMGHKTNYKAPHIPASDEHYFSRQDVEFQRQLYKEKAMPFLRLETATPTETERTIAELKGQLEERDKEIDAMKETLVKIQPLVEFVNSFNAPEQLKTILDYLKDDFMYSSDDKLRPLKIEFSPHVSEKLDEIAKRKGVTRKEAIEQLVKEDLEIMEKGEEKRKKIAKARGLPITREEYEEQKKKRKGLKK